MKLSDFKSTRIVFCVPEVQSVEYDEKSGRFAGPLEPIITRYFGIVMKLFNTTVKIPKGQKNIRDAASGSLPGCFGLLQTGEADINLYPFQMPLIDIENVTQVNVTSLQSGTYMLSPYSRKESLDVVALGPLHSFSSVSFDVWVIAALVFIAFTYILLLARHLSKVAGKGEEGLHDQSALYQVATHLVLHENCNFSGDSARFISILMSSFAFFFITLFSSMVASEKVSTRSFTIYDTYEKILSNRLVQPVWIQNFDDYSQYKRSPPGSPRHKLWAQSAAISRDDKSRPALVQVDADKIGTLTEFIKKKQIVLFISNLVAELFNAMACNCIFSTIEGFDSLKDVRFKGTIDTQATSSLYVVPVSRHSTLEVSVAIGLAIERITENALGSQPDLAIETGQYLAKNIMHAKIIYQDDYTKCMNFEVLPIDDPETVPLVLTTAVELFRWWAIGCSVAFVVFLIEFKYRNFNCEIVNRTVSSARRRY